MTSDAKIGLLLGLVFIFVIAFIINGLPSFSDAGNNNELTVNMVGLQNKPAGLGAKERKVSREIIEQMEPVKEQSLDKLRAPATGSQDIRFATLLPKSPLVLEESIEVEPAARLRPAATVKEGGRGEIEPNKSALPKVYIVSEGDNLSVVAKKFYGAKEGNKKVNITRIFEANRSVLRSPDEIYVGQKLLIPLLTTSSLDKSGVSSILASPMLEKVESIGRRHLPTNGRGAKQGRWYVVRDGDSLWRIAAEQLGDGSRYSKIAKLNAGILEDEDSLVVGMRLKMPAQ